MIQFFVNIVGQKSILTLNFATNAVKNSNLFYILYAPAKILDTQSGVRNFSFGREKEDFHPATNVAGGCRSNVSWIKTVPLFLEITYIFSQARYRF